jgi:hypothetical protein
MDEEELDYDDECLGTEEIFPTDADFIRMQKSKQASDMEVIEPLDPPKKINPEASLHSRGPLWNAVEGRFSNKLKHAAQHKKNG